MGFTALQPFLVFIFAIFRLLAPLEGKTHVKCRTVFIIFHRGNLISMQITFHSINILFHSKKILEKMKNALKSDNKYTLLNYKCMKRPQTAIEQTMSFRKLTDILEGKYASVREKNRNLQRSACKKNQPKKELNKSKTLAKSRASKSNAPSKENGILFHIETILQSTRKTINTSQCLKKEITVPQISRT